MHRTTRMAVAVRSVIVVIPKPAVRAITVPAYTEGIMTSNEGQRTSDVLSECIT